MRLPLSIFTTFVLFLYASHVSAQEPVWDGNKVELVSERIAEGVFAYYAKDAKELEKPGKPVATSRGIEPIQARIANVLVPSDGKFTLEETVKTVSMSEFSGYALFGWVHPGLNVPAAYKDLAGK